MHEEVLVCALTAMIMFPLQDLRTTRKQKGLSIEDLAEGVAMPGTIISIETGNRVPQAESPPSKNLDQNWAGFFYGKCRSKPCQLWLSGVLPLNGFGWLNVLVSI